MDKITLIKPDDAHLHLRDGPYLARTVADAAQRFARAIVMPNLKPPLVTLQQIIDYKQRIQSTIPPGAEFEPLMTLYLTASMSTELMRQAKESGLVTALKLYPAGVTTHSEAGISNLAAIYPLLAAMEEQDLPLLVHGESNNPAVDIFDREKYFLDDLAKIQTSFPSLRIVLEHITTEDAVQLVLAGGKNLAATITVHHLMFNRNHLLAGGIHPHLYCLPILKRSHHQEALLNAAISGNHKFFLGSDSAPHSMMTKESACGCAGIYSGHAAIELYAEVFDSLGSLDKLESFASHYAADFYRLARSKTTITLVRQEWTVPEQLQFGDEALVPLRAGTTIRWRMG